MNYNNLFSQAISNNVVLKVITENVNILVNDYKFC